MLSQLFFVSPTAFVVGIGAVRQPRAFLTMTVRDTGHGDSELRQALQRLRRAPGTWEAYIRLPVRDYSLQLLFFDRVLTWPLDQPRHATKIFNSSGRFQVAPPSKPTSAPADTAPERRIRALIIDDPAARQRRIGPAVEWWPGRSRCLAVQARRFRHLRWCR